MPNPIIRDINQLNIPLLGSTYDFILANEIGFSKVAPRKAVQGGAQLPEVTVLHNTAKVLRERMEDEDLDGIDPTTELLYLISQVYRPLVIKEGALLIQYMLPEAEDYDPLDVWMEVTTVNPQTQNLLTSINAKVYPVVTNSNESAMTRHMMYAHMFIVEAWQMVKDRVADFEIADKAKEAEKVQEAEAQVDEYTAKIQQAIDLHGTCKAANSLYLEQLSELVPLITELSLSTQRLNDSISGDLVGAQKLLDDLKLADTTGGNKRSPEMVLFRIFLAHSNPMHIAKHLRKLDPKGEVMQFFVTMARMEGVYDRYRKHLQ